MVTRIDDQQAHTPPSTVDEIPSPARPGENQIHIATVNVRLNRTTYTPPNPQNPHAERPWSERKTRLVDALLSTGQLDIVGFQEVLHDQLIDLVDLLPGYTHVGVGRDDGKQAGEYSPIFFDSERYEAVKWGTVWLSPTPDVPGSKGWDAALPRIATLLTLRPRTFKQSAEPKAQQLIHVVNTHYDHLGVRARAESSLLIRSQIWRWVKSVEEEERVGEEGAVILFGDFNSPPTEDGYRNITSLHPLPSGQPSFTFLDSYSHLLIRSFAAQQRASGGETASRLRQTAPYGPVETYTDFAPPGSRQRTRIDFIMLGTRTRTDVGGTTGVDDASGAQSEAEAQAEAVARGGWRVARYACIDNFVEGDRDGWAGRWSDHRAVRVTLVTDRA